MATDSLAISDGVQNKVECQSVGDLSTLRTILILVCCSLARKVLLKTFCFQRAIYNLFGCAQFIESKSRLGHGMDVFQPFLPLENLMVFAGEYQENSGKWSESLENQIIL
jgi:hypothetical protein